ncbi:hypothetical protein [Roseiterribacter gracilis]
MTNAPPNTPPDDPALAMSRIWQADCDQLNRFCTTASNRERAMFDAPLAERPAAERAYIEARDARDKLSDRLDACARALEKTKAQSIEGVAGKIAVTILQNAPEPQSAEPPWPMLRSCVDDLERLAKRST